MRGALPTIFRQHQVAIVRAERTCGILGTACHRQDFSGFALLRQCENERMGTLEEELQKMYDPRFTCVSAGFGMAEST